MSERHISPRAWGVVIGIEIVLIFALIGLGVFQYYQARTQHQICQIFSFVGDRTQQQIGITSTQLKIDLRNGDKAKVSLDRKSISEATGFLIRARRIDC